MPTTRTMKTVTIAGIVASLALAGVAYRMNGGGGTAWCLVGFALGEYAAFQYLFFCSSYRCPPLGENGHAECVTRCLLTFIIIQVMLIVALVACVFSTGLGL